jgi:TolB-like protein
MTAQSEAISTVSHDAARAALNKVLSSEVLQGSERSRTLLKFVVERTLSGQADGLKEYTLGTEALGKGPAFDPRIDAVVRSEASRLRTRLEKYYATEGQSDSVVIVLRKGSYIPRFERRTIASGSTVDATGERPWRAVRWRAPLAIAAAALIAAIALISYRELAPSNAPAGLEAERAAAASDSSAVAIAVLPFLNLSGDAGQDFFSDGMTEEITATLARIPDLKIVARTSAFQFKGQNRDIQSIGRQLHATHLIEGSVRKDGNRVRITAQLVETASGVQVSSESYDRELSDILATQEDIARTIVGALMAPLGLAPGERLIASRNIDPESYQQYLRARGLLRARGITRITDAITMLEQVVARDPGYASGWALLSLAYALTPNFHPAYYNVSVDDLRRVVDASFPRAEAAALRAIQLDPSGADGYTALALVQQRRGRLLQSEETFLKALALDPDNPEALNLYSNLLSSVGQLKEDLAMKLRLRALEPFVPTYTINAAFTLWLNGQNDAASAMLQELPPETPFGALTFAMMYAATGHYVEAADLVLQIPSGIYPPGAVEEAARVLRTAPATAASPPMLPPMGNLVFVYLYGGAPDRVLELYEGHAEAGFALNSQELWHPSYAIVRKTERFKTLVRSYGLVEYWRAKGWPQWCRPVGAGDFVCN